MQDQLSSYIPRTRRPHAPRHPSPAGAGRKPRSDRTRRAIRDVHARSVEAPESTGECWADRAWARGTMAALQARCGTSQRSRRLDRRLSPLLGKQSLNRLDKYLREIEGDSQDEIKNEWFQERRVREIQIQGVRSHGPISQCSERTRQPNLPFSAEPSTHLLRRCVERIYPA